MSKNKIFTAGCPYCNSEEWAPKKDTLLGQDYDREIHFDDIFCYVIAVCCDCKKEFEIQYEIKKISKMEGGN